MRMQMRGAESSIWASIENTVVPSRRVNVSRPIINEPSR